MIETFGRLHGAGPDAYYVDRLSTLGDPASTVVKLAPDQSMAWQKYFSNFADDLDQKRMALLEKFSSMKEMYAMLGIPLYDVTGAAKSDNVWTKEKEQDLSNVNGTVLLAVQAMRDAAAGTRKINIVNGNDWAIEQLPSDNGRTIQLDDKGVPELVDAAGSKVQIVGTLGGPELIAILIAGVLAQAVIVGGAALVLTTFIEAAGSVIDRVMDTRNNEIWAQCLQAQAQSGNNQDFCMKAIKAIEDQQVNQRKAETDKKAAPSGTVSEVASVLKWGMVFIGGGAVLYAGIKYGLPMLEEHKAERKAREKAIEKALWRTRTLSSAGFRRGRWRSPSSPARPCSFRCRRRRDRNTRPRSTRSASSRSMRS